jgi:hypothetical protein
MRPPPSNRRHALVLGTTLAVALLGSACNERSSPAPPVSTTADMNQLADRYVTLVLQVGQHDPDFVDAYYGDPAKKPTGAPLPLADLTSAVVRLRADLAALPEDPAADELSRLRRTYLGKQLIAIETRIAMLAGHKYTFDEEARLLYDAEPPHRTEADFAPIHAELEKLLPGQGGLPERFAEFRKRYFIPPDRVDAVFRAAIDACRERTLPHVALPAGETFRVEYVTGKSWSAYNWYQGNFTSLIQVNTDLPITIDRALDLACHEGYPGHHVYNALLEKHLVRDRGWNEFAVYPLFSPQSLIAEGTANFGLEVAFPGAAQTEFESATLYPIAGLDPKTAAAYNAVLDAIDKLSYAGNEAARRYLNGEIDRTAAADYLERWAMSPRDRAEQRTKFFDQYRSYVINYNLGKDLVRTYVESQTGAAADPETRWKEFVKLLSSPRLPSGLR